MKACRRPIVVWFACAVLTNFAACGTPAANTPAEGTSLDSHFDQGTLQIVSNEGTRLEFNIYVAITPQQQRRGLMFVRKMPDRTGMLFVYEDADFHSMWMKNTFIPLDIVFARGDGSISSLIHDTQPLSLAPQSSIEPVTYVLELNAGTARQLNIGRKSHLTWKLIGN